MALVLIELEDEENENGDTELRVKIDFVNGLNADSATVAQSCGMKLMKHLSEITKAEN